MAQWRAHGVVGVSAVELSSCVWTSNYICTLGRSASKHSELPQRHILSEVRHMPFPGEWNGPRHESIAICSDSLLRLVWHFPLDDSISHCLPGRVLLSQRSTRFNKSNRTGRAGEHLFHAMSLKTFPRGAPAARSSQRNSSHEHLSSESKAKHTVVCRQHTCY